MKAHYSVSGRLPAVAALLVSASVAQAVTLAGNGAPTAGDANLRLWLDASDAATLFQDAAGTSAVTAGGQSVRRWDSKATSNAISVQNLTGGATGTRQPSFTSSVAALGNQASVSFNGDVLTSTTGNSTGITGSSANLTLITVWNRTATTGMNYQHTIHLGTSIANQAYGHSVSRSTNAGQIGNHYWQNGNEFAASSTNGTGYLTLSTYNGTSDIDTFYNNGELLGTFTNTSLNISANQLQIGSRLNPYAEGFTGDLAEVIIYDTVLTESERSSISSYVANKYGIALVPEPSVSLLTLVGVGAGLAIRRRPRG